MHPADSQIFSPLFNHPDIAHIFSDTRFIRYLLEVEAAVARAEARLGIIPAAAAVAIEKASRTLEVDIGQLRDSTEKAGLPIIELVKQLRTAVGPEAADYVHWGATTQDIMDTALILQLRDALAILEPLLHETITHLGQLADQHRQTVLAGRTHSQQALPITFGLKAAGWLAPLLRHRQRLAELKGRLLVLQFGGAAGTLAPFGRQGIAVQQALAQELGLAVPPMPWHTQRDHVVELAGWLSLVSGSLAKMAQDIILMAQTEVGELRETADFSRGGSSTMPQKSNPIISELILAAARTNASLLGNMHQALIQEHERATHGWQVEWLTLPQMVTLTAAALSKAHFLSQNLQVDAAQMAHNVEQSLGLMLGEALNFALAEHMDRAAAKQLIKEAVQIALTEQRHLVDIVQEQVDYPLDWPSLRQEANYLGTADQIITRILAEI